MAGVIRSTPWLRVMAREEGQTPLHPPLLFPFASYTMIPRYQSSCRASILKIDLHVHTNPLSPDSFMSAEQAIETAKEIGLDGICLTEHDRAWQLSEIQLLREKHGFRVFRGVEVMLRGGIEMLVFGLNMD